MAEPVPAHSDALDSGQCPLPGPAPVAPHPLVEHPPVPARPSVQETEFDGACKWPYCINQSEDPRKSSLSLSIPAFFCALNGATAKAMAHVFPAHDVRDWNTVTCSHFLPRRDLYWGYPALRKV